MPNFENDGNIIKCSCAASAPVKNVGFQRSARKGGVVGIEDWCSLKPVFVWASTWYGGLTRTCLSGARYRDHITPVSPCTASTGFHFQNCGSRMEMQEIFDLCLCACALGLCLYREYDECLFALQTNSVKWRGGPFRIYVRPYRGPLKPCYATSHFNIDLRAGDRESSEIVLDCCRRQLDVDLPKVQTLVGQRSFAFHRPTVFYQQLRDSSLSLNKFQRQLKIHLFGQS